MKTNPNDTAYPATESGLTHFGLTKREYFAAAALACLDEDKLQWEEAAERAVKIAYYLIEQLNMVEA